MDSFEQYKLLLDKFSQFLGQFPPSVELATQFLAKYDNHAPLTLARYAGIIRGFMEWYGESFNIRPPATRPLPQYVESGDVDRLIDVIRHKQTHKRTIVRDILLVKFDRMTGLRAGELAHLTVGDIRIKDKVVMVRKGKGSKDRAIPLHSSLVDEVGDFVRDMKPTDRVFGLKARSITDKISTWSSKAGLKLHTHSLRHHFAEQLIDTGAEITVVQKLMGHENLQTTAAYLGLRPGSMQNAVDRLGTSKANEITTKEKASKPETSEGAETGVGGSLQKLSAEPPVKQDPYVETPHRQKIRELAKSLAEAVSSLPSHWDKNLWRDLPLEFKPGKYYLPVGLVQIDKDKQITVKYHDIGAGIAEPHLLKSLRSHLSTSGLTMFLEIVSDDGELRKLTAKAEQYSQKLMDLAKLISDDIDIFGAKVNFKDEDKPGLTRWFIITIWNDAIQKAGDRSWINDSWYKPYKSVQGYKWELRCGAYPIVISENGSTLNAFWPKTSMKRNRN